MSDAKSQQSKAAAMAFLGALAQGPENCRDLITDDFVWRVTQSMVEVFKLESRNLKGVEGLKRLLQIDGQVYKDPENIKTTTHFCIAEGDWVAMQSETAATTLRDEPYLNYYVFTFRIQDGKVAEVWQHVDTLYSWHKTFKYVNQ